MNNFNAWVEAINAVLWSSPVLYTLLFTGVVFTFWSGFSQYYALTHGFKVIRGDYDKADDPGAITHFQALSAALSATVGLGNIGGGRFSWNGDQTDRGFIGNAAQRHV